MADRDTPVMKWWLKAIIVIGVLNFAVFITVSIIIGGDAVNGYVSGCHYYLGSHGRYTEVTPAVFNYSRWHVYSLFITHPAAMLAAFRLNGIRRRR